MQLIAPILILMTEKWATEQSCIHIEITSCKIPSLDAEMLFVQLIFNHFVITTRQMFFNIEDFITWGSRKNQAFMLDFWNF